MLLLANNKEQSRHSLYHLWSLYQKSDGNVMALADPAHFYEQLLSLDWRAGCATSAYRQGAAALWRMVWMDI